MKKTYKTPKVENRPILTETLCSTSDVNVPVGGTTDEFGARSESHITNSEIISL